MARTKLLIEGLGSLATRRVNLPEGTIAIRMRRKRGDCREKGKEGGRVALLHCLPGARLRVNNVTVTPGFVLARNAKILRKTAFASPKSAV